jgi:hypothetical protein
MTSPADPGYQVAKLIDRIAQLEGQVGTLMRLVGVVGQRAEVVSAAGAMCNVRFLATLTVAPVPYLLGYTPVPGHGGHVVDLGSGRMFIPVSAF